MTIYNANGVELYDAPITSKDIIKCVLMGDYYIELSFNTGAYIDFTVGSYILYQGRKFEILYTQYPDAHHGGYKYTLRFDAQQGKMKKAKVFWLASANHETTFSNTAKLADFGQLIVANMNRYLGGDNWLWGGVSAYEDDVLKPVSFNGDFCWDALSNIASTFGVEWWTVEDGDEVRLYMGKLEVGTPETFKVGEVITSIPTRRGEDAEYGTRFYVFGSTRNIPEDYDTTEQGGPTNHISQKRLHLPNGIQYIDAIEGLTPEQIVEQVVFFEDVYPKNTETVTAVDVEYKEIVEGEENAVYIMQCNDTPFTPDNLITGETLGCKFTSGDLNGREFELIIDTENFDQRFEIKAQTEDAGDTVLVIPNEYLHPKQGDTFVLTGVKLPTERIREAEEELLDVGTAWAMKKSSDTNVYDCPTNPVYCRENDKNYDIGQVVRLVGMQFGNVGRLSRIQSYEKKLYDEYQATYTVGDNTPYSRMGSIEKSIEESAYAERIGIASGVGVYVIRSKYDLTTPTDTNVYSALYTALEYLSKRKGGNIAGPVTFDKSLTTSDFKQGELMGAGAGIYDDGKGNKVVEADKIIVRKEAVFNELVINQTTFQRGTTVFSCGGCRLTAVEEYDTYYRCYYDNKGELRFAGLEVGDQARCQRYDASYGAIVKYYWRLVVGVGKDYVDLSKTDCDGTGVPAEGDDIVQLGNRNDATRQSAVVISPLNGGVVEVFAGINSFSLSEKNYVGMGVDAATGEAYIYGYGRMFFGDRGEGQYIKYEKGDDGEYHLKINADVTLGASSDLSGSTQFAELGKQVGSKIESHYDDYDGGKDVLADEWAESGIEAEHEGDIFTNTETGATWHWISAWDGNQHSYQWVATADVKAQASIDNIFNQGVVTPADLLALETELSKIATEYENIKAQSDKFLSGEALDHFGYYEYCYDEYSGWLGMIINVVKQGNIDDRAERLYDEKGRYYSSLKTVSAYISSAIKADITDLDYLKNVFPNALLDVKGASLAQLLGVKDGDNNIVAGLYGGADDTLNANGFYDEEHHRTLMFFAGAKDGISDGKVASAATRIYDDGTIYTNKLIATNADISGKIVSGEGEVGGFEIDGNSLEATSTPFSNHVAKMLLSASIIKFTDNLNDSLVARMSLGVSDGGWAGEDHAVTGLLKIDIDCNLSYAHTGAVIKAKNAYNTNTALRLSASSEHENAHNYALYTEQGDIFVEQGRIIGLRPNISVITSGTTLSPSQNIVLCNNTSAMTLTLPSSAYIGQMYIIRRLTSNANVTIQAPPGSYIVSGSRSMSEAISQNPTITLSNYHAVELHYAEVGDKKIWVANYMAYNI